MVTSKLVFSAALRNLIYNLNLKLYNNINSLYIKLMRNNNHNTAQNLLTDKVPIAFENQTISDVEQLMLSKIKQFETVNYIYVINHTNKLIGVLSIKELFRSPQKTPLKNLITQKPLTVRSHTDQERVAYLALKHNIKALPVVDKNGIFLGSVTSDKILETLFYETTEDTMKLGGVLKTATFDNIFELSIFKSLKHRLPWLALGLLGGMLTSGIVSSFEDILSKNIILAAFIPLIVYMADAVGTQMEAFIIRDLAVNPALKFRKYFTHQMLIVVTTGLILSILTYGGILLFYGDIRTGIVISLALFCAIMTSLLSGLTIPFLLNKIKLDPANASGPIATIIQDITSVTVYFLIASSVL